MIQLATERLILRPYNLSDAPSLFAMNTDAEVLQYTGDTGFENLKDAQEYIADYVSNPDGQIKKYKMGRLACIDKTNGEFLGFCGLKTDEDTGITDLGYRFLRKHWGKGYATESCIAVLEFGFKTHLKDQIVAHVHEYNYGSQRVVEKLGFTLEHRFLWDGELPGRYYKIRKDAYNN
ncbi:GNAT family N-acetyltransferase [Nonlabens antarcticus]|uniref:GNAT family N-acetyltransferase n=1 Tax=Nonlabens antarcticus TaxID=392714 RepID=UPI001891C9B6|nr:GNAT family N-acetyltransferase [Nonlabens antarcticus]